ncbi:MAG: two-component system sensor histidine kinase CreC [Candidatus Aminicenantes bacterium]|nr:two-component system sensor histidine kinase CreC [Candidatus Aminicenantes bacterium]NIM80704.1 two-component system sensor histidine kinase CreC [Candidatus Aminicenantes bacterium]NIN20079.1 two-component system sensor histidine kinase CreC [Candidatus Aminicenantes bacterium]NIN43866.1 two-component system sensor histidine kinase CreC [Candidatus Aminicenantes bacterium]NIN86675.1 two-component system sensor histidine kinase CreC [Candidatus Aminicenantes bacterium]
MKISYRIFLGFVVILAAGFISLISWIMSDVNVQPKKSMEEPMVDIAHILAAYLEQEIRDNKIVTEPLRRVLDNVGKRRFMARIYELEKEEVSMGVYVTNKQGTVIFDSNNGQWEGEDFSDRHDVLRTMRGEYGARTTRLDPGDPLSSVAYVGAPVMVNGEIFGVCTVSKPWKSINTFIDTTRRNILVAGLLGFAAALGLSFFISRWITLPIRRLTNYAETVKEGERPLFPDLGKGEIKELGESFEKMRESLEGKKYIEKYVQTLTHQLKGPLSAIKGAAELLQEDLAEQDRKKFITNIDIESNRLQRIVERMLELASLEHRRELQNVETIDLSQMVKDIVEEMSVILEKKEIILSLKVGEGFCLKGERFLVFQAVFNLLQNAVDFTPNGGFISVEIKEHFRRLFLIIRDSGAGIPDYAVDKVFDKFYSLQRPETGKKSSGLGLSLVKEVAELHKGEITLKKNKPNGTVAMLRLPMGVFK